MLNRGIFKNWSILHGVIINSFSKNTILLGKDNPLGLSVIKSSCQQTQFIGNVAYTAHRGNGFIPQYIQLWMNQLFFTSPASQSIHQQ